MTQGPRRNRSSYSARENGRLSSGQSHKNGFRTRQDQASKHGQVTRQSQTTRQSQNASLANTAPSQHDLQDQCETIMRLNKALASAGLCSRRQADVLIERGSVTVNGHVVTELGCKVDTERDSISVDGRPLPQAQSHDLTYLMVNKPVQVVTTVHDPQGRETVLDLLPSRFRAQRLFPVGRLDFFSEGLLLLTNDGELTNRLTHPRWHLPKVYYVRVRGNLTAAKLEIMRRGMRLAEGERLAPVEVERIHGDASSSLLQMTLHQGINRQIRRMCRDLDLTVLRLSRIAQGPLELGNLEIGQCRPLTSAELRKLRRAVDL